MSLASQFSLTNPVLIVAVVVAAALFGVHFPNEASHFEQIGAFYIGLLKMFVLPYLVAAITTSIIKLLSDAKTSSILMRIAGTFVASMFITALVSLACALMFPPAGDLDSNALAVLGNLINEGSGSDKIIPDAEIAFFGHTAPETGASQIVQVVGRFIPENIFAALSAGDNLKVLVFCIIFGIAVARASSPGYRLILEILDVVQLASAWVIRAFNLVLPFALFAMVSSQVAKTGLGPLVSMASFVKVQTIAAAVLIALSTLVISLRSKKSPWFVFGRLFEVITLAVTTRNSIACIPAAVKDLADRIGFERQRSELVLPLTITICRLGAISFYVIGSVFVAQIYGVDLTVANYVAIIILSVVAGLASSGTSGPVTILLISLVVAPLNLPVEAAVVLFIAVDPIVDMVRTVLLVYCNCAVASVLVPYERKGSVDHVSATRSAA